LPALQTAEKRRLQLRLKILLGFWFGLIFSTLVHAQTWRRLGPEGGLVVSLGTSASGGVYLGTADGHVFFSGDGARSWELRGRVGQRLDAVVTRLVADLRSENRVFASVWYQAAGAGGGVFRSDDAGRTWTLLGLEKEAVRALEISASSPDTLAAGTLTGIFRSRDAGKDWERISPAGDPELRNIDSLAIDPRNPDLIYAGTYHLPWKTQDGGKSWSPVIAGIIDDSDIMSLRIDASNPARVFMSACSGIYRSENQGAQWIKLQGIPYSARRTQAIVQNPADPKLLYAGTTEGLWVTRDAGESWTRTTPKEWIVNSVVVLGANSGTARRVVLGTETGIQVSNDEGMHFSEANQGFTHVIVNQFVGDAKRPGHFLIVAESEGQKLLESEGAGKGWTPVPWPEAAHGAPAKPEGKRLERVYASPWGWLARMGDGTLLLREDSNGAWKQFALRAPAGVASMKKRSASSEATRTSREVRLEGAGAELVFAKDAAFIFSTAGVLRCSVPGSCVQAKAFADGGPIRALWASQDGLDLLVVRDGKLGISSNGGASATWRDLPVAEDQILWLDAEESADQTVFLGTANGLYIAAAAATPWKQVQGGLPAAAVVQWLRRQEFWVATERAGRMYVSRDRGASWVRVDRDAERGSFTGLAWGSPETVLAGSQSEGVLELELPTREGP
jgi:photosystem II stability/assembly factor-like uncharacterized protein